MHFPPEAVITSWSRRNFESITKMQIHLGNYVRNLNKMCSTFRGDFKTPADSQTEGQRRRFLNPYPTTACPMRPNSPWVILLETKKSPTDHPVFLPLFSEDSSTKVAHLMFSTPSRQESSGDQLRSRPRPRGKPDDSLTTGPAERGYQPSSPRR